ncbi:MAG: hypothetical protein QW533_06550, partial [Thermoplasmata archaeon]
LEKKDSKIEFVKHIKNLNEDFWLIMKFQYKEDDKGNEYNILVTGGGITYISDFETIAQLLKKMYNIKIERAKDVKLENDNVNAIKTTDDDGNSVIKIYTRQHDITLPIDGTLRIIINDSKKLCIMSCIDRIANSGDDNGQPDKVENNTD